MWGALILSHQTPASEAWGPVPRTAGLSGRNAEAGRAGGVRGCRCALAAQ